jgi:hypothetical protein
MRYLGEDDITQMMGIGRVGEVRQGPDGRLYQWVQGVDGLGNPIGFWRALRRVGRGLRRVAQRALPIVQQVAPLVPGGGAVTAALRTAAPVLRQAGVTGHNGLGALYQAPDGSLYQVQGLAQDEELQGLGEDELTQMMGIGYVGEVRQGPDGKLYQWVQGVDGLGNPVGFWRALRRVGRGLRRVARRALPIVQQVAPLIPGGGVVTAALRTAAPVLRQAGVTGHNGLGALYQAPDGSLYQVQGLGQDEDLRGLSEDEDLQGLAQDEELQGLAEDEELPGLAEDEELQGLAEDEEVQGFGQDEELQGLDQGYVRQDRMNGLEAYVPEQPASTRWFTPPNQPPEMWKPLW